jgi:lipopolysaccharide biosynthesis glycosyltransferase
MRYSNLKLKIIDASFMNELFIDKLNKENKFNSLVKGEFGRLFLGGLIDDDIEKILYLDCDTIVEGDLNELFNTNLEDNYVGGIIEFFNIILIKILHLNPCANCINSGVLLINLKKWREDNLEGKFLNEINKYIDNPNLNDQSLINKVLQCRIKILHPKYNYGPCKFRQRLYRFAYKLNKGKYYSKDQIMESPIIIHFITNKPWFENITIPLKNRFLYYKNISPFKNNSLRQFKEYNGFKTGIISIMEIFLKDPVFTPLTVYFFRYKNEKTVKKNWSLDE